VSENASPTRAAVELLSRGDLEVMGLIPYSSNYVFLARVCDNSSESLAVYKPRRGERPLWDFPRGSLAAREVAAFLVSEASGWCLVPPTVLRTDAPLGTGSLQLFIEHDPERHYFTLLDERLEDFIVFAAFDVVINNADRKAGHVLEDPSGRLWGVDHGVSFHVEEKLRTVIWHLAEERLPQEVMSRLRVLRTALANRSGLGERLAELLSSREVAAAVQRVDRLLATQVLPPPSGERPLPWPLI
jgi:uncharacterized repeat protein (TIGR03843 family)